MGQEYPAYTFSFWLDYAEQWFTNRPVWIDKQMSSIVVIDVNQIESVSEKTADDSWYDLYGRRISEADAKHRIFIHNGKKYVR